MTRQRNDSHSTEFGLWLRKQPEIDSKLGYVGHNIDYLWLYYKTGKWMLIEEKRYCAECGYSQKEAFKIIHKACKTDKNYHGFHLIQFDCTSPDDSSIWLDGKIITKENLIAFLQFKEI